jgi:hypothetical protein
VAAFVERPAPNRCSIKLLMLMFISVVHLRFVCWNCHRFELLLLMACASSRHSRNFLLCVRASVSASRFLHSRLLSEAIDESIFCRKYQRDFTKLGLKCSVCCENPVGREISQWSFLIVHIDTERV